jgi:hypothetical protein
MDPMKARRLKNTKIPNADEHQANKLKSMTCFRLKNILVTFSLTMPKKELVCTYLLKTYSDASQVFKSMNS